MKTKIVISIVVILFIAFLIVMPTMADKISEFLISIFI